MKNNSQSFKWNNFSAPGVLNLRYAYSLRIAVGSTRWTNGKISKIILYSKSVKYYFLKLNVEDDLRLYLTKLEPNIDQLYKENPAQSSH